MSRLSTAVLLLLAFVACTDDADEPRATLPTATAKAPVPDDAARAACGRWRDEVLPNLGEEEFASSGRFLPALDEIARDAARSSVPGLGAAAADLARRAQAVVASGEAAGYEDAVRAFELACMRSGASAPTAGN